jgi:hypothetical protein
VKINGNSEVLRSVDPITTGVRAYLHFKVFANIDADTSNIQTMAIIPTASPLVNQCMTSITLLAPLAPPLNKVTYSSLFDNRSPAQPYVCECVIFLYLVADHLRVIVCAA